MVPTIEIKQAQEHLGKTVQIRGHIQSMRNLGQIAFLIVRDKNSTVQVVVEEASLLNQLSDLPLETPCIFTGVFQNKPKAQSKGAAEATMGGGSEMLLEAIKPLAFGLETCPVELGKPAKMEGLAPATLFDYRPLTLRNEKVRAIFKIEAQILQAFRSYLNSQGFMEIHSPKIVATGTEGGAQLFALDYFGKGAYLAQSPQFYKQMMVGVFERVFEVGPVYRAEEHDTSRHLNEYVSLDFEMGFIESEQDIIAMQEGLLKHILNHLAEHCSEELAMHGARLPELAANQTIAQIELAQARELLQGHYGWQGESDLDNEGEKLLCQHFHKNHGSEFVYVTNYPHSIRPFYAMPRASQGGLNGPGSKSFDLLLRGLEITTGGQRIHEYQALRESISARGLNPEEFSDYLLCFKHGMPPHGGLAIGLERLTKQILGLPSVKQCALFPRDRNRLTP